MNILLLSKYSRLGASSRLRTMQYMDTLLKAGFTIELSSFFDEEYLRALYAGGSTATGVLRALSRRFRRMQSKPLPDLLWIEKEVLPWVTWLFERRLLPKDGPIVADYDDAMFHQYDLHKSIVEGASIQHIETACDALQTLMKDPDLPARCRATAKAMFSLEAGTEAYRGIDASILNLKDA